MTSRTLYLNFAHKICSSGHLLEILPFICWGPTSNRRDNHKLEIPFKFSTKYCFFDSEKGFKWTSIGSLHTSGSRSYQLHFFVFCKHDSCNLLRKDTTKARHGIRREIIPPILSKNCALTSHAHSQHHTLTEPHTTLTHKQMYTSTPDNVRAALLVAV